MRSRSTRLWEELTGGDSPLFGAVADGAKFEQATTTFAPEVEWLARDLGAAASQVVLARALSSLPVSERMSSHVQARSTRRIAR